MSWYGGSKEMDVRNVALDQAGANTRVDITIEAQTVYSPNDTLVLFLDSTQDGKSDRFVSFYGFSNGTYSALAGATPDSTVNCQRTINHGDPFTDEDKAMPTPSGGRQTFTTTIPTARLGGATSFRWAVYALNDSFSPGPSYDYAPNASNPRGDANAVADRDRDGCDTDGDGEYGDLRTIEDGAYPVRMAGGAQFGTATTPADDPNPGSGPQGPGQPPAMPTISPVQYVKTGGSMRMPDLRPRSRNCRQGCTEDEARQLLVTAGLANAKLSVERVSRLPRSARRYRNLVDDGEVFAQSIKPGNKLTVPSLAEQRFLYRTPPAIKLSAFRDKDLDLGCDKKDLEQRLNGRAWPGLSSGRGANRVRGAKDLLTKDLKCNWRITRYAKKSKISAPVIGSADVKGSKKRVNLTIDLPKTTELAIEVSDKPGHPGFNGRDVAGLDRGDGAMPVTGTGFGGFVVKVYYTGMAPSREAAGVRVMVTDGDGSAAASAVTDANGEAALYGHFRKSGNDGYITATMPIGDMGLSLDGQQPLKVKAAASKTYRTDIGRWVQKNARGVYRTINVAGGAATARAAVVCKGVDAGGNTFFITDLKAMADTARAEFAKAQTATSPQMRRFYLDGVFNVVDTMVRGGGTDQQVFAELVRDINIGPASVGNGTSSNGSCNLTQAEINTIFPRRDGAVAATVKGFPLKQGPVSTISGAGQARLPDSGFIRDSIDKNATLLGQAGGNLIGQAGGNVISTGGLNVISTGGLNIISTDGAGIISTDGASLISDKGLGIMSDNGGGLIGQAGGN